MTDDGASSEAAPATGLRGHRVLDPERSANRRGEILRVAARVFADKGYHLSTVEDIARAMGVSKGVVYYYFRSKDEICTEVICMAIEGALARLDAVVAEPISPAEMLRKALAVHVEYNVNDEEEGYYAMLVMHDIKALSPASTRRVRELQRAYVRAFREIVQRGVMAGELANRDIGVTTLVMLTTANYITDWYRFNGRLSIDEVVKHVADQLVDGILRPEKASSGR